MTIWYDLIDVENGIKSNKPRRSLFSILDGMPYIESHFYFTGVDYHANLSDRNSDAFQYHARKFCKEVACLHLNIVFLLFFYHLFFIYHYTF